MDFPEDGPTQSLDEHLHEVQHQDLFALARMMPPRPQGNDPSYQPPAHDVLPLLQEGLDKWGEVEQALKARVPQDLNFEADLGSKRFGDGWQSLAVSSPQVRRFWQVSLVRSVMLHLFEILRDESRPQGPPPDLSLGKMRREGWSK